MRAYYNEFDTYCAQWLRNLIDAGHIPPGDVDERSITEVKADEIKDYDQWHFFAGLGGWGYAARLAGIGDASGILTGSPPCQPFSTAGKRQGYADNRHLAPVWLDLVAALRPAWVFGEQVAAAIKKDDWLDDLLDALETEGYATGAAVLPACGVGAPHIRQRLWFVAGLANTDALRRQRERRSSPPQSERIAQREQVSRRKSESETGWANADWFSCRDEHWRPAESGTFPLADGVPARVGRLRAYGNAIVPQVAAKIIKAAMEKSNAK